MKWGIGSFKGWTSKRWGNPFTDIHDAETEIQRLIEKRTLMKSQLRELPDLIQAQFEIINKAKALLKESE